MIQFSDDPVEHRIQKRGLAQRKRVAKFIAKCVPSSAAHSQEQLLICELEWRPT